MGFKNIGEVVGAELNGNVRDYTFGEKLHPKLLQAEYGLTYL